MDFQKRKDIIDAVIQVLGTIDFITEEELYTIIDELGLEGQILKVCFKSNSLVDIVEELKSQLNK